MRVDEDVLQYILRAQSFNESDMAFIMHLMFKDIYRTDSKGQWYSKSSTWILRDIFDIRDLIGSAVCNTAVSCVNAIKNSPHLYKVEGFNTFDTMTIVRSVHTKVFVDRVMEEAAGLFIGDI